MNHRLRLAAQAITAGGVVAYPTEAVYGLGCDPWNRAAIERLLRMKRRDQTPCGGLRCAHPA